MGATRIVLPFPIAGGGRDGEEGRGLSEASRFVAMDSTYTVDVYSMRKMTSNEPSNIAPGQFLYPNVRNSVRFVKASLKRWMNAVLRMTPVPKCFPMKNNKLGIRMACIRCAAVGNPAAATETRNMTPTAA